MRLLDGKALAQKIFVELKQELIALKKRLRLAVVVVGEDPVVRSFIAEKKKAAEAVGIDVRIYPFDAGITTNELRKRIAEIVHEKKNTGVIIQLPLPLKINSQYILNAILPDKGADVLSSCSTGNFATGGYFATGKRPIFPPVAGAIKALFEEYKIDYIEKYIAVVGAGGLVGRPAVLWLVQEGATVWVITEKTVHPERILAQADIIISGVGKPRLITGDMVKVGVVVIDAGTSESAGEVVGDVDFDSVAPKASYITPVPGGVGPLTVAVLMRNVVALGTKK
jgi:methylenetetrahydrofolate dehydrogenase (NADP+)/methenyltetrahydrofolate cyclohydrolase